MDVDARRGKCGAELNQDASGYEFFYVNGLPAGPRETRDPLYVLREIIRGGKLPVRIVPATELIPGVSSVWVFDTCMFGSIPFPMYDEYRMQDHGIDKAIVNVPGYECIVDVSGGTACELIGAVPVMSKSAAVEVVIVRVTMELARPGCLGCSSYSAMLEVVKFVRREAPASG
jgi:hypothetical protein